MMATGGYDSVVDSRVTCSICLEPYEGRCPKILPCFHTFCSPCLTQLADRETARSLQVAPSAHGVDAGSPGVSPVSITCPTCRTSSPLPPGGVASLQNNFYLPDEADQHDPRPLLCDLCEEGEEAKYTCPTCLAYFCSRCRRIHNKLCKSPLVSEVPAKGAAGGEGGKEAARATCDPLQVVEDVLKKLADQEQRLGRERTAREHDVHVRYAALLRHAGEARDASLVSLRDVTQVLADALQADVTVARDLLPRMKRETAGRGSTSRSSASSGDVLTEADRRRFEELLQKEEGEALLRFQPSNGDAEALVKCHRDFMGTVVAVGQDCSDTVDSQRANPAAGGDRQPQSPDASPQPATARREDPPQESAGQASRLDHLTARYAQTESLVTVLQNQNTLLCRDLTSLRDQNTKHGADVTSLRNEVTSLRDAGNRVRDDLTSLQRDHVSVRDKNSLLCQESQDIRSDLNAVQKDQGKLGTDVSTIQADQSKLQANQNQLQTDHSKVQTDVITLQTDHNKLQTDHNKLQADHNKLQTDHNKLQTDQNKLQTDHNKLQTDHNKLQADHNKLQMDHNKLQTDQKSVQKEVGDLNRNHSALGKELSSLQDSLKKDSLAIATLETAMSKFNIQVAFHARLKDDVTLTGRQTVICDDVIASVGGGYDDKTGIFTAPVSGIYCFMATSGPRSADVNEFCCLHLVLEDKNIGFLIALGKALSTCHAAVQVKAGHKVKLRAYTSDGHPTNWYGGGWGTSFTGMLLQPEV